MSCPGGEPIEEDQDTSDPYADLPYLPDLPWTWRSVAAVSVLIVGMAAHLLVTLWFLVKSYG